MKEVEMESKKELPLVYSCSGCSSAAQMANHVALQLDRRNVAEMSCIAGVGGDVPALVKLARSGRPVIAIDGCALACAKNCLKRQGVEPDWYYQLNQHGVKKRFHADFDQAQAEEMTNRISEETAASSAITQDAS
jgi:uncharacterized metal-binding protein